MNDHPRDRGRFDAANWMAHHGLVALVVVKSSDRATIGGRRGNGHSLIELGTQAGLVMTQG